MNELRQAGWENYFGIVPKLRAFRVCGREGSFGVSWLKIQ
jgi:hypothetical protein